MSLKHLKPITITRTSSLADGYQLFPIADKWAETLPDCVPLQFSLFRCVRSHCVGRHVASVERCCCVLMCRRMSYVVTCV